MWIMMKESYAGEQGSFSKDLKYDLPLVTLMRLPKGCYKKTCPPWDEKIDKKAVALQNARAAAQAAADVVTHLEREIDSAKTQLEQLGHHVETKTNQLDKADVDAKRLAKIAKGKADKIAKAEAEAKAKAEAEAKAKAEAEAKAKAEAEAEQSQESEDAGQEKEQTGAGQPEGVNGQPEGQAVSA